MRAKTVARVEFAIAGNGDNDASQHALRTLRRDVIAPMAEDFIGWVVADDQLARLFRSDYSADRWNLIRRNVIDYFCRMTGGACEYRGRDMKTVHAGLGINERDWTTAAALLVAALTKHGVAIPEQIEFMRLIEGVKDTIVDRHA